MLRCVTEREQREQLGRAITEQMLALDFNQTSLASKAGVSVATIRKLQKGAEQGYELATIYKLARALGFDPAVMFDQAHGRAGEGSLRHTKVYAQTATGAGDAFDAHVDTPAAFDAKLSKLTPDQREAIERLVDTMLGES